MYVTRPLSLYLRNPAALSELPPEGPSSGILVVQESDKNLTIHYTIRHAGGESASSTTYADDVILIPVLGKPLSSNQYYAIQPHGRHKGYASDPTNTLFS